MPEVIVPVVTDPTIVPVVVAVPTMSILAVAVGITQLIMLFVNSKYGDIAGKWKLLIVSGVSLVSAFLGQLAIDVVWYVALTSGVVITALQVFVHQIYAQLNKTKETA